MTPAERLAYPLVAALKKFIDPALGFLSIRLVPWGDVVGRFYLALQAPVSPAPGERRRLSVEVRGGELRLAFRRGRWGRSEAFAASGPTFERDVAELIGRHWRCYFPTYWMSL
jgi:hypothetical protein